MGRFRVPRRWLSQASAPVFALYGGLMAFGAYFAMYAFRKPFAVASFADAAPVLVQYKIALVIAQVFGYALSKVAGVKIISETPAHRRSGAILLLIGLAELALVGLRCPAALEHRLHVPQRTCARHDLGACLRLPRRTARFRSPWRDAMREFHRFVRRREVRRQERDAGRHRQRILDAGRHRPLFRAASADLRLRPRRHAAAECRGRSPARGARADGCGRAALHVPRLRARTHRPDRRLCRAHCAEGLSGQFRPRNLEQPRLPQRCRDLHLFRDSRRGDRAGHARHC